MKNLLILTVGKLKDPRLRQLCDAYYQRCGRRFQVREREVKEVHALAAAIPKKSTLVVLDERGEQLTSRGFAAQLNRWLQLPAKQPVLVIGGADGLPGQLRGRADFLLSLGRMTFAHRLVRLTLAEQLYRAVSILDGAPYHRD